MDPFTVLNVPHDAGPEEIEEAWKSKLRLVHPDRHPDASPEVRSRLAHRTAQVNEAYRELTAQRAAGAPPPPPPSPTQSPAPPRTSSTRPPGSPTPFPPSRPGRATGRVLAVLAIAATVLVALVVVAIGGGGGSGTPRPTPVGGQVGSVVYFALSSDVIAVPGSCLTGSDLRLIVDCTHPHEATITARASTPAECPAGTDAVAVDRDPVVCVDWDR